MPKHLSCAISRLPVLEANTILRVSRHIPGLQPFHLLCCAGMTDVPVTQRASGGHQRSAHDSPDLADRQFGRRPRARGATFMGPASENLHKSGRVCPLLCEHGFRADGVQRLCVAAIMRSAMTTRAGRLQKSQPQAVKTLSPNASGQKAPQRPRRS
jgi:hypothetical protein